MSRLVPILLLIAVLCLGACRSHDGHGGLAPADRAALDAMHHEHAGEAPTASPATQRATDVRVAVETVVYAHLGGRPVEGVLAYPAAATGPRPGLILIHEWWGLNDNIREMARLFAAEGYTVLAVDLFEGETAADAQRARALVQAAMGRPERVQDNLGQAIAYLREARAAPRVATLGWCFGGAWALRAALARPDALDAAVIYYGNVETDRQALAALGATPILALFGEADASIPLERVRAFEAALAANGTPHEVVVYPGADHAFANPSGSRYQAEAAEDAWRRATAFLATHLGR